MTGSLSETPPRTLAELLHRTVLRYGDAPAVRCADQALDYDELWRRSRRLAARLGAAGVRPEGRIAVHLPRSSETVVAVMGIVLAGAAYVPVDDQYPAARRTQLMRDAELDLVVTAPGWARRFDDLGVPALEWDSRTDGQPEDGRLGPIEPANAACVLFTSGSTGTPKGVVLEHRQMVAFATDPAVPPLQLGDRVGQAASISFDTFTFEVWRAVAAGAETAVIPAMAELIERDLQRELRRRRITAMLAPATALNHVVRYDREAFSSLRVLCSGGDVLLPATTRDLRAGGFTGILYNLYGPTEGTVACTAYPIGEHGEPGDVVPIGFPLAGARLYVLDEQFQPCPPGTPGQLYVAGAGLGRGYLNRPELTASAFVADPFAADGSRMYATGDRVTAGADGALRFLGRVDGQVKVSGYRVEPAEVERLICARPGVRATAVLAVGPAGGRRLVAFVVLAEAGVLLRDLRAGLAAEVPPYLVPAEFVVIEQMPMDAHGKRDWQRLRDLHEELSAARSEYVPARTSTERWLVGSWEDLLARESVGAHDDFFALGGHSILAVRLRMSIQRELGVRVPPEALFEHSVLADQAKMVDSCREVTP
ncbi:amino acid adenylation domain-containing protein [Micromonospora pallida]|uniref:Amino acid adenylation domain-containing protein n=1 Tax=Micromonospora pallida TaxID=145854 RepID=A0A1C6SD72_9ACTN|nr:non-ribosomal peptide synthetase [Micromonospora pallida]SCL27423.1 amino acid adenylation domain-containing protein [Micromonospora pallida]